MQEAITVPLRRSGLAIVWGVQIFRPFLVATHFEILTDHYALRVVEIHEEAPQRSSIAGQLPLRTIGLPFSIGQANSRDM